MILNINMSDPNEVNQVMEDVENFITEYNQIIDDIVIGEIGIDIWKIVVIPSNSTIVNVTGDDNQTNNNQTNQGNNNNTNNNNQGN